MSQDPSGWCDFPLRAEDDLLLVRRLSGYLDERAHRHKAVARAAVVVVVGGGVARAAAAAVAHAGRLEAVEKVLIFIRYITQGNALHIALHSIAARHASPRGGRDGGGESQS